MIAAVVATTAYAALLLPKGIAAGKARRKNNCPGAAPYVADHVSAVCSGHFPTGDSRSPDAADYSRWVVHFYGKDCRRCLEVAPAIAEAAQLATSQVGAAVLYGAVDCHHPQNHRLCKDKGAWKLPMLKALGCGSRYLGTYEASAIHEWAISATGAETPLPTRGSAFALCPAYELYDEPRIAREFLHAHNVYRCVSGLKLLEWDSKAFATARRWAQRAPIGRLEHSPEDQRKGPGGVTYGENVAIGDWLEPGQVVARWYAEIRNTKGGQVPRPHHQAGLGHYTQIVWRKTERVACSLAQNRHVAVCHYFPPGNLRGRHLTQVAPPLPGYTGIAGEERCGGPVDQIKL